MSLVTSNLTFATGVQFCSKMFTTEEIGSLEVVKSNLFFTIYSVQCPGRFYPHLIWFWLFHNEEAHLELLPNTRVRKSELHLWVKLSERTLCFIKFVPWICEYMLFSTAGSQGNALVGEWPGENTPKVNLFLCFLRNVKLSSEMYLEAGVSSLTIRWTLWRQPCIFCAFFLLCSTQAISSR